MAQDLSQTIQEGVAQTLTDLLGVDAKLQETTKIDKRDIQNTQLLQVNAEFEFDKLTTVFQFMIPASSASIIFNTMMGATDYEISEVLDDDTVDAMGEFVSNVSGSLVTAFNAQEVEDLGKAKFNIQHKEVLDGDSIENIDTMFRFVIELNDQPLTVFINFGEEFLPHIEEISKVEPTPYPEEEITAEPEEESLEDASNDDLAESIENDDVPDPESVITGDNAGIDNTPEEKKDTEENETPENEDEDEETVKKSKKMKLLIIIVSSLIILILVAFLTLFLMSPDEEEMENTEQKTEQMENNETSKEENKEKQEDLTITSKKTLKKINFNIKDIDIGRLNGRLATLTKYEVLTQEELEIQKKEESLRLKRLKEEEELKEFAKLNKEEPVEIKPEAKPKEEKPQSTAKNKNPIAEKKMEKPTPEIKPVENTLKQVVKKEAIMSPKEIEKQMIPKTAETQAKEMVKEEPKKLLFVLSNSIKYRLFKSLVLQTNSQNTRISMCNDSSGRTTILIGPFNTLEKQTQMTQLIKNADANIDTSIENLTQEEFNQRCNF